MKTKFLLLIFLSLTFFCYDVTAQQQNITLIDSIHRLYREIDPSEIPTGILFR